MVGSWRLHHGIRLAATVKLSISPKAVGSRVVQNFHRNELKSMESQGIFPADRRVKVPGTETSPVTWKWFTVMMFRGSFDCAFLALLDFLYF